VASLAFLDSFTQEDVAQTINLPLSFFGIISVVRDGKHLKLAELEDQDYIKCFSEAEYEYEYAFITPAMYGSLRVAHGRRFSQ
jgi:hypothetical protein